MPRFPPRARTAAPRSRRSGSTPRRRTSSSFKTNCGTFTVTLDQAGAPATAASLVALAKDGFYDDTIFHRIVPGFVIQGGDPTQTGAGGPGYKTVDAPPADAAYTKGVVAMAKTAARGRRAPRAASSSSSPATTSGCRPTTRSSATVTEGLDVVELIGTLGDRADGAADAARRHRVGHGRGAVSVAAVVLAAGEASRFGTPKQRLLLPEVLERLEQSPVDEIVVVAGAHTLETPAARRHVRRLEARPGRIARGRPRGARATSVEAAVVVLADGPDLAPGSGRARDRVVAGRRRHDRRGLLRRRARPSAARRTRGVGIDPRRGPA